MKPTNQKLTRDQQVAASELARLIQLLAESDRPGVRLIGPVLLSRLEHILKHSTSVVAMDQAELLAFLTKLESGRLIPPEPRKQTGLSNMANLDMGAREVERVVNRLLGSKDMHGDLLSIAGRLRMMQEAALALIEEEETK
jgi:hypothetical protein